MTSKSVALGSTKKKKRDLRVSGRHMLSLLRITEV
jgi:hypothetical protein